VHLGQERQVDGRFRRLRILHGGGHGHHGIVDVWRVQLHVHIVFLLVAGAEIVHAFLLRARHAARFRAGDHVFAHGVAGQLAQRFRAQAIAAHELGLDAQRLHLAQHRAAHGIHAAEEDQVGIFRLDAGQDGVEVRRVSIGKFLADDLHARRRLLGALDELFGHALAVGRTVIDDGDFLRLQLAHGIRAQSSPQLVVIGHDAEGRVEFLLGIGRVGGGRRNLRNAGIEVNARGGNRRARVQMADDTVDLGVDQLLRHGRALLGVGCVIFGHQHEFHGLAVDLEAFGVQILDGHIGRVLVILAQVGAGARDRGDVAYLDDFLCARMAGKGEGDGEWKDFGLEQHKHSPMDKDTAASRENRFDRRYV